MFCSKSLWSDRVGCWLYWWFCIDVGGRWLKWFVGFVENVICLLVCSLSGCISEWMDRSIIGYIFWFWWCSFSVKRILLERLIWKLGCRRWIGCVLGGIVVVIWVCIF